MRTLQIFVAVVGIIGSVPMLRIVHHGYADHAYLDVFHLAVGITLVSACLFVLRAALRNRRSSEAAQ